MREPCAPAFPEPGIERFSSKEWGGLRMAAEVPRLESGSGRGGVVNRGATPRGGDRAQGIGMAQTFVFAGSPEGTASPPAGAGGALLGRLVAVRAGRGGHQFGGLLFADRRTLVSGHSIPGDVADPGTGGRGAGFGGSNAGHTGRGGPVRAGWIWPAIHFSWRWGCTAEYLPRVWRRPANTDPVSEAGGGQSQRGDILYRSISS